jgi:hypothetical protein
MAVESVLPASEVPIQAPASPITRKKKPKKKNKKKGNYNKPSKWADQCMYAELLEMATDDPAWSTDDGLNEGADGLPKDLESGWVAIAPVPVGKRCLVVTHQTAGVTGTGKCGLWAQHLWWLMLERCASSSKHDYSISIAGEVAHTPVSLTPTSFDGTRLHLRC